MLAALLCLATSAAPISLAMPGLNGVNLAPGEGELFSELLAQKLSESGLKVVTSRDIGAVLGLDRQRELLGCSGTSCPSELAGALGVDGIVVGDIGKIGASYVVNLKVVSKNGDPIALFSAEQADVSPALHQGARSLAHQLAQALKRPDLEPKAEAVTAAPATQMLRPVGIAAIAGGVIALAIGCGAQVAAQGKLGALRQAGSVDLAGQLRDEGKSWQLAAGTLLSLGATAAVIGGVLLVLSIRAPAPAVAVLPGGGAAFVLSGAWP